MKITNTRHTWTKDEIRKVIKIWDDKNIEDLTRELKVSQQQLMYMVKSLRDEGVKLAKKHHKGYLRNLIKEVVEEMN